MTQRRSSPTLPVDEACAILFQWLDLITSEPALSGASGDAFKRIAAVKADIKLAVEKSNYLARRLYGGELHRTEPCSAHGGRWSGWAAPGSRWSDCECLSGLNITGWLKPSDESSTGRTE